MVKLFYKILKYYQNTLVATEVEMKEYKITYELDGGIGHNPSTYTENDRIVLSQPLRPGYRFAGWQGASSVIQKGSRGDRVYTAKWTRINASVDVEAKRTVNHDCDKDISPSSAPVAISAPSGKGSRGEDIYTVKTVYTDICIDGVKDPAYDYGVHLRSNVSNAPEYYADKDTGFDAYIIRTFLLRSPTHL